MKSSTTPKFRAALAAIPDEVQNIAIKQFKLWRANPFHPSVQFKKVRGFWSARVNDDYRALAHFKNDVYHWFWIGPHKDYDRFIKQIKESRQ